MKYRWTVILFSIVLALVSCVKDIEPFDDSGPSKRAQRDGTPGLHFDKMMILYSEGYNNLQGSLNKNIDELCEGYIPPKWGKEAIVVFSHASLTSSNWQTDTEPVVFRIYEQYGEVVRDTVFRYPAESISVEKEFMKKVLGDIKDRFPSDSYGMVYTSHGTGWIPKDYKKTSETFSLKPTGVGAEFDGTYPSYTYIQLDIDEFRGAIPYHMDYIVMDACLMGGVEVVYEWRDICDYLAASPGEVLTVGFDYYKIAERLLKGEKPDLVGICRDYYEMNAIDRDNNGRQDGDATIALYDCSKIVALAEACAPIFETHRSAIPTLKPSKVQSFNYTYQYHFDFRDILVKLGASDEELAPVDAALEDLVLYKNATDVFLNNIITTFSGLSMFLPTSGGAILNERYKSTSWNQATGFVK